jgi:hypothetical protein
MGAHRTQAGSLCYIDADTSSLRVHGESFRDGFDRSLGSPESQCSIGFQPVFCFHLSDAFRTIDDPGGRIAGRRRLPGWFFPARTGLRTLLASLDAQGVQRKSVFHGRLFEPLKPAAISAVTSAHIGF